MRYSNPVAQQRRRFLAAAAGLSIAAMLASASSRTRAQGPLEFTPLKKKRAPASPLGLSLEETRTALPDGGGDVPALLVTRAVGLAAQAGLQTGDLVIELNGKPVAGLANFWDRVAVADWRLHLRALRGGKTLSFRLNGSAVNEQPR